MTMICGTRKISDRTTLSDIAQTIKVARSVFGDELNLNPEWDSYLSDFMRIVRQFAEGKIMAGIEPIEHSLEDYNLAYSDDNEYHYKMNIERLYSLFKYNVADAYNSYLFSISEMEDKGKREEVTIIVYYLNQCLRDIDDSYQSNELRKIRHAVYDKYDVSIWDLVREWEITRKQKVLSR